MALTSIGLSQAAFKQYLIYNPTAVAAMRSNPLSGNPLLVVPHCVPAAMIDGISAGLFIALPKLVVSDIFSGSASPPALPPPVPFVIPPPIMSGARTAFMASMVPPWAPTAIPTATALVDGVMTALMGVTQIQMNPPPGMGLGNGVINAGSLSAAGFPAACAAALLEGLITGIGTTGKFNILDGVWTSTTPQMILMMTNLATAYTTCLSGMTAAVVYPGGTTPTGIGGINTGKFI